MKWIRPTKHPSNQPQTGTYPDWKEQIAEECHQRCVYCAIPTSRFGGLRCFHVEHFRPKKHFKSLENDISNLYLACCICNCFKADDWPSEPREEVPSYLDPAVTDFNEKYRLQPGYRVEGVVHATRYTAERLHLNRAQLILERRRALLLQRLNAISCYLGSVFGPLVSAEETTLLGELGIQLTRTMQIRERLDNAVPYRKKDLRER